MKILSFADLHSNNYYKDNQTEYIKDIINKVKPDLILIAGDVVEKFIIKNNNVFKYIRNVLFNMTDVPVVFCLGNHEFIDQSIQETHNNVKKYVKNNYNCFCLDIDGRFTINDINIVGNVLWYDNSLKSVPAQKDDFIIDGWIDKYIIDFIPSVECTKCKQEIISNIDENKKNILLTHCVPYYKLNWFTVDAPLSEYNMYSGCYDFLNELKNKNVLWSICGHTHHFMNGTYHGISCVNIGNDYFFRNNNIKYFEFEI